MTRQEYHLSLLGNRANRLNELLNIAAPDELICKEVLLIMQAAIPLNPGVFKNFLSKDFLNTRYIAIG
jgi:hypothetical protein